MNAKASIIIIEDEKNICNFIETVLTPQNYHVVCAYTGADGLKQINTHKPDVVLLDLGLPDMDGLEIIEELRAYSSVPIIVISARTLERSKVAALDMGADDYLTKPFGTAELLARIRVMLRREGGRIDNCYRIANLKVDCDARCVFRDDIPIALSSKEFSILEYLICNQGIVLSREKIEQHIWNYDYEGGSNVVDVYIRYLRKKIDDGFTPKLIHTVRGAGYVLKEA